METCKTSPESLHPGVSLDSSYQINCKNILLTGRIVQQSFKAGSAITGAVWFGARPVISTSSGAVMVFGDSEATFTSHAGSANALALHPCGDILASVGVDKSFVFYDLATGKAITQVYTDSGKEFNLCPPVIHNAKIC